MNIIERLLYALGAGLVLVSSPSVLAQDYPTRPIKLIMPFGPGGPTDVVARLLAQSLTTRLGHTVLVENRPGANGIIGSEVVAKSPPDGYTLLIAPTAHAINPSMYRKLPYDTLRDFASVAYIGNSPGLVLVVANPVQAKTVQELVALAKQKDAKLAYGSAGVGNLLHLAAEYFNDATGTHLLHVPYKSAGAVLTALYSGEIQVAFLGPVQATGLLNEGKLRALAVSSPKRIPQLPDIPTMAESGYPAYDFDGGIQAAVYAPANTPREIIDKLNREINVVLNEPAVRQRFEGFALDAGGGPPEVLDRQVRTRMDKYAQIIRAAKIEPE